MSRKKSVEEHLRDGTYRKDRHGPVPEGATVAAEAGAAVGAAGNSVADVKKPPKIPGDLPVEAAKVWRQLTGLLAGVVCERDGPLLGDACRWWAELKRVQAALALSKPGDKGYNQLLIGAGICSDKLDKILSRFGLTPADRAKLKVEVSGAPVAKVPARPKDLL